MAFLGLGVLLGLQGYYEYKMRFWCDNLVKSLALARGWEKVEWEEVEWEEVEWKEREGKEGEDEEEKREGGDGGRWGVNGEKGEMIDF